LALRNLKPFLENNPIEASAPCRLDMGGTLDIRTFHHPLSWLRPCTVNMALDMRTRVRLLPFSQGQVRVSSRGFESAAMPLDKVPFDHPLGLIFAVAYYFRAGGVHIEIESASPPRSALGGSSVAAVALIAAISKALGQLEGATPLDRSETAVLAHAIEESAAGVPCGIQDQLAAVYGGIHRWKWPCDVQDPPFKKESLMSNDEAGDFGRHLLVAYCGVPHESKDINGTWIRQFLSGDTRLQWIEIARCSRRFADALEKGDLPDALESMRLEMAIRKEMTPDVLDNLGDRLAASASDRGCVARITGAGGGGCIWALGRVGDIEQLRPAWEHILASRPEARLLDCGIDTLGVTTEA
jgi:D-glycero-alpha-D-manno-heptose-7-phosphate kinase